ncbi:ATP-dependent DNA helicase [Saccharomycopsis crataegensis]|uniref:ATP-dependent DNA helicase II subunit 1 n=1 Tax=Saccharomycopsis crataegensis TaxID=43959 RepID=A0AAV5QU90_9ASCO|nr:ATP-dependent DNA helicase [Saccharomycopsis crataegensis]
MPTVKREDIVYRDRYELKEAILFMVELTDAMYEPSEELQGEAPLREILKAINGVMADLAISLPTTGIGCYFFNSKNTTKGCKDGIYRYFSMKSVNVQVNKKINDDLSDTDPENKEGVELKEKFPMINYSTPAEFEKNRTSLNNVLYQIKSEFIFKTENAKRYNYKKVFFITHNDKPYDTTSPDAGDVKKSIKASLDDLYNAKINFVTFLLNKSHTETFDKTQYSELIYLTSDNSSVKSEDQLREDGDYYGINVEAMSIKEINQRIHRRSEVKRVNFNCLLEIGKDLMIEVKGYSLFSEAEPKKPSVVYNKAEVPKTVLRASKFFTEGSAKAISDSKEDIISAYQFGDDLIYLNKKQISQIKCLDQENGEIRHEGKLSIIGFRRISKTLNYQYNMGKSSFIHVETKGNYTNTFKVFSCLFQSCCQMDRAAIVWGVTRRDSYPNLYALVPSTYQGLSEGFVSNKHLQGFFLIPLPYEDSIRGVPPSLKPIAIPDVLTDSATRWLNKFKLKDGYVPSNYSNPSLQWHYKVLRDEALLVDVPEYLDDRVENFNEEQMKEYIRFDKNSIKLEKYHNASMKPDRAEAIQGFKSILAKISD